MEYGKEYYEYCKNKNLFDMKAKGDWQKRYVEYIRSVFGDLNGKKCLDFGCALGSQTSAFVDAGVDMLGVDVSDFYVKECPFGNLKGRMFTYDGTLPFPDKHFDFIHSAQVIEHIPENQLLNVLSELKRVLKPDGVIYFATCGEVIKLSESGNDDPTHIVGLSKDIWYKHFKVAGMTVIGSGLDETWMNQAMFKEYKWVQYVIAHAPIPVVIPEPTQIPEPIPDQIPLRLESEVIGKPEQIEILDEPFPIVKSAKRKKGKSY